MYILQDAFLAYLFNHDILHCLHQRICFKVPFRWSQHTYSFCWAHVALSTPLIETPAGVLSVAAICLTAIAVALKTPGYAKLGTDVGRVKRDGSQPPDSCWKKYTLNPRRCLVYLVNMMLDFGKEWFQWLEFGWNPQPSLTVGMFGCWNHGVLSSFERGPSGWIGLK